MIERLSEAMGAALVCNIFLRNPSKLDFHMKETNLRHSPNLQTMKTS